MSRVRCLLCALFLVAVVVTGAVALPQEPAEIWTATPAAAGVAAPAASAVVTPVAGEAVDGDVLDVALREAGVELPPGSGVYAVRLNDGPEGLTYEAFEAGEGATYDGFWPASSVKLLAAVGALEYLADLGFTGAARITMEGRSFTVADVYDAAIAESSNEAYDRLVRIAGVDWLNAEFLTGANGFPATVIQRSYTGDGVDVSPAMTVVEGGRRVTVPARRATGIYACPDDGNCSNLLELTESVARVTLDAELPEEDRFAIAEVDIAGLRDALLESEGFVEPAVAAALGESTLVYNKPGYVPGDDCIDVAMLADDSGAARYLLAVATPEDGSLCPGLVAIAAATLAFLDGTVA